MSEGKHRDNGGGDQGFAHTIIGLLAVLGLILSVVAISAAIYEGGDGKKVAVVAPEQSAAKPIDFGGTPQPGWKPYDPALAPAPGGTEHQVTLHATETQLNMAPGVTQTMWTFGDTVPGPVLRGKVGDVFTVTLINDGKNGHSIDFHASEVAPNVEMRTIAPGESLVYQFTATHSGIWMYHCGTPPVIHHVGNGMYGAVIIDPPDLAPVDREFVFVQSELYRKGVTDAGMTHMLNEQWDAVMFNGYVNQYVNHPIRVEPGQKIRAWVLDAGPSENSSFHVIGTVFDTVYFEGRYELRPDDSHGGSQALALQPAQGGFVEFDFEHPGTYPFLTHKLATASKGALGIFQVGPPAGEPMSH